MGGLGFFKKATPILTNNHAALSCSDCGLDKGCISPYMPISGEGKKGIFILAEAPGKTEDEQNTQLIGDAGQLLRRKLEAHGIDLDRDCWKFNSVNCRPEDNRTPTKKELACCRKRVMEAIKEVNPKIIFAMGSSALHSLMMNKYENDKLEISVWKRLLIPDRETGKWIVPLFHPSALLNNKDACLEASFDLDLKFALSCAQLNPPELPEYEKMVEVVKDADRLLTLLDKPANIIAIDYETSGLKPYRQGHKIYTMSIAYSETQAFSFPLQYPHWTEDQLWKITEKVCDLLADPDIEMIAHNIKFEHKWAKHILGVQTESWLWDSCLAAHILDSRKHHSSLKFQAVTKYGAPNYGAELDKYIKKENKEGFNDVHKAPLDNLLLYNGLDALFTYKLFVDQQKQFNRYPKFFNIYYLFHDGALALSESEDCGINISSDFYAQQKKDLQKEASEIEKEIMESQYVKMFSRKFGRKPLISSPDDLRIIFFDLMGNEVKKRTAKKQQAAVTEEVLSKMDNPLASKILQMRKVEKIVSTYIEQFEREAYENKLNPLFDLNTTETGRSSSQRPNLQNIPKRNKKAKQAARSGIIPSPGFQLVEADFGSLEVRIMACHTKDPALIKYIEDKTTDMHRDQACDCFFLTPDQVPKNVRGIAKGDFVFAQFYGDWFKTCAANLWEDSKEERLLDGTMVHDHLAKHGCPDLAAYENHIKGVEDRFWARLRVSKEWRDAVVEKYKKTGYVESMSGFRRVGYLRRNQIMNAPVQGDAFHCLLWAYVKLNELRKKQNWHSKIIGQIHDAVLFDADPKELPFLLPLIKRVMTKDILTAFPWISVPLEVEIEVGDIDAPWSTL